MNDRQRRTSLFVLAVAAMLVAAGPHLASRIPNVIQDVIPRPNDFTGCFAITVTQSGTLTTDQDIVSESIGSLAKDAGMVFTNYDTDQPAGVKYLAFLKNKYFNDVRIRPRDQVRLALAAYNAGPGKIQRVRAKTKQMGLDPNRWFRNVELATLKMVGQETVRYVSNINKYYVIYRFTSKVSETREKEMKEIGKKAN